MLRPLGAYYRIDTRSITDMPVALNPSNPIARHSGGASFALGLGTLHFAQPTKPVLAKLMKKVDLRTQCPPSFNQKTPPPHFRWRSQLKGCLAAGYPFVFGFSVYESFESEAVAKIGKVPMPGGSTEKKLGGHAVFAVEYDEATQRFIVINSWGTGWAIKGCCTFLYAYLLDANLCDGFGTVRVVE